MIARALLAAWAAVTALALSAATPPASPAAAPAVLLPPMLVEETSKAPPWLYAAAGDTEFLSRCSPAATRAFITAQLDRHRALRGFVPAEFLATNAVPLVSLLAPLASMPAHDDALFRDLLQTAARGDTLAFLPNQRLDDRDMMAAFTFLNENAFDAERLIVSVEFLRAQLNRRTPQLPAWFIEGVVGLYQQADASSDLIVLHRFVWISPAETAALQRDPEARRPVLPANELFAPDALLGADNTNAARAAAWRAQTALFIRWALDPVHAPARAALWRLADRASQEPMTEALFIDCFGFGYSDLRDRLSDYLAFAVNDPVRLPDDNLPPRPTFELKPATPAQSARLRGEWERLVIPFVRGRYPQFLPRYVVQARHTLQRAVARDRSDPQLLAAAGLCELDAGDAAAALPLLESAVAARVARPRNAFEVARLRWVELTRETPPAQLFTAAQLEPVFAPLRAALSSAPALPEIYLLALDAWLRCTAPTPPAELDALADAARLFRRIPAVGLRVALLQAKNGRRADAVATLTSGLEFLADPTARAQHQQFLAALATPP